MKVKNIQIFFFGSIKKKKKIKNDILPTRCHLTIFTKAIEWGEMGFIKEYKKLSEMDIILSHAGR